MDPLAALQPQMSSYHYVHNNPINRIDPTGKSDRRLGADEFPSVSHTGSHVGQESTNVNRGSESITVITTSNENYGSVVTSLSTLTGSSGNISNVSNKSAVVIAGSMQATGESSIAVSSTTRTPAKQASTMFNNIKSKGVKNQKALYGSAGDKVIDAYVTASKSKGATAATIQNAMVTKINSLGAQNVSRHCGDNSALNVIDLAPSSMSNVSKFQNHLSNNSGSKVIKYPKDPAVHVEIKQ